VLSVAAFVRMHDADDADGLAAEAGAGNRSGREATCYQMQRHLQPSPIDQTLPRMGAAYF